MYRNLKRRFLYILQFVMITVLFIWVTQSISAARLLPGTQYYISPSGDDGNDGLTPGTAWQTITAVNTFTFARGDSILFEGGQTFSGNLTLDSTDCATGTVGDIITISSYGTGRATINAGTDNGIFVHSCDYVEVTELTVVGDGRFTNSGRGIYFYTDIPGDVKLEHIIIDNTEVSGFQKAGITIAAWNNLTGFQSVEITNNDVHDNGNAGISVWGYTAPSLVGHPHQKFIIANNKTYDNPGDPTDINSHTGSGISVGNLDGATIEYNEAYNNGAANVYAGGGPVGIWAWDCNNVTIQFNESYENKTQTLDGGGFDLDSGCSNSIIQYNYSHNNDGPGFLMAQAPGSRPMQNNIIRYNISANDVRRGTTYGAITLWRGGGTFSGLDIYHNTIYLTDGVNSTPMMFRSMSNNIQNVGVYNNIFAIDDGLQLLDLDGANNNSQFTFAGNDYFAATGTYIFDDVGTIYNSLADWRLGTGQEMVSGNPVGTDVDPEFSGILAPSTTTDFRLSVTSPLIDMGLDLTQFGITPPTLDYEGKLVPVNGVIDFGPIEYAVPTAVQLQTFQAQALPHYLTALVGLFALLTVALWVTRSRSPNN